MTPVLQYLQFIHRFRVIQYFTALHKRKQALWECQLARRRLDGSVEEIVSAYQAHPLPVLAGAAGIGFVLARLRVGSRLVDAGKRIPTGPTWHLVRKFIDQLG